MTSTAGTAVGMEIARELYTLGIDMLRLGKTRAAAFQFRKALAIAPDFSDASLALGH
ncbi:MAG: tetratricopeptide repeat protein, partial [Steroidobacteraceae bacterium]|nr:tetratricopeptide repeat protein [Deltaproteobacteria bacterium]